MIEEHLESLSSGSYSKRTLDVAAVWLKKFSDFCDNRELTELKEQDLQDWHKHLLWVPGINGKLYSQNTVNQAIGVIRRFYRWAVSEGRTKTDPTTKLVTPRVKDAKPSKLELKPSQARKLLASPNLDTVTGTRDRAVLGIILETKISHSACSHIDLDDLQLDIGALFTQGRTRQVHSLSDGLLCDLERYLDESRPLLVSLPNEAVFLNIHGRRLTGPSIQQLIRYHRNRCEL